MFIDLSNADLQSPRTRSRLRMRSGGAPCVPLFTRTWNNPAPTTRLLIELSVPRSIPVLTRFSSKHQHRYRYVSLNRFPEFVQTRMHCGQHVEGNRSIFTRSGVEDEMSASISNPNPPDPARVGPSKSARMTAQQRYTTSWRTTRLIVVTPCCTRIHPPAVTRSQT